MNSIEVPTKIIWNNVREVVIEKTLIHRILTVVYFFVAFAFPMIGLCESVSIRLYDELQGHDDVILSMAFNSEGKLLGSGDASGGIIIWKIEDNEFIKYRQYKIEHERIDSLLFSADGRFLFSVSNIRKPFSWGNKKRVRKWEINGKKSKALQIYNFDEPVKSISLSLDGRTLLVGGEKGKIGAIDINTGRLIKTLKNAHRKEVLYLVWTGEHTFQSIGADRKMKYWDTSSSAPVLTCVDEQEYEINTTVCNSSMDICAIGGFALRFKKNMREKYIFHNIYLKDGISWSRIGNLKGHDLEINALAFSPQGDFLASGGKGKMIYLWDIEKGRIEADVQYGSEITALSFSPNGQWVAAAGEDKLLSLYKMEGFSKTKTIPENIITADADQTPGEKYAVIIALSKFKDPNISPLQYTVKDAEAFYQFLISEKGGRFSKNKIRLLLDHEATKVNIEDVLENFLPRKAGKDDTVIIFFAGHGTPDIDLTDRSDDGVEKYLVPYDADLEKISATCIPMSEFDLIFSSIRSRRVIFFLDSCFSGGGAGKTEVPDVLRRTFISRPKRLRGFTITPKFLTQLTEGSKGYGKVLITASQANEQALELDAFGHGLFTYYLLEALNGKADDGDGFITLKEAYDYLEERVAMQSRKVGGKQTPMMVGSITGKIVLSTVK